MRGHCRVLRKRWAPRPTGSPNPFEVYLLLAGAVSGVSVLGGWATPTSVRAALTPLLLHIWAVLLGAGGSAALAGLFWPGNPFTGVEVKRAGLVAAGCGALIYGSAALLLGPPGFAVATYNLLYAAACATRVVQVSRLVQAARDHLAEVRGEFAARSTDGIPDAPRR